jgi:hypothetical protein
MFPAGNVKALHGKNILEISIHIDGIAKIGTNCDHRVCWIPAIASFRVANVNNLNINE